MHSQETTMLSNVFLEHRHLLKSVALKIVKSSEMAEDIVQELYLRLLETGGGSNIKQPVAYLCRATRNLAVDQHRRAMFESHVFGLEEEGLNVASRSENPECIVIARDSLRVVMDALATLPERTRVAFELHRMDEFTQRDIATTLKVSPTLVNFMIRDACTALLPHNDRVLAN